MKHLIFLPKVKCIRVDEKGVVVVSYDSSGSFTTIKPNDEVHWIYGHTAINVHDQTAQALEIGVLVEKWRREVGDEAESA